MQVTRDVISDLWPVYAAGEASQATREIVESFLEDDREFARLLKQSTELDVCNLRSAGDDQGEVWVIHRTRRILAMREWLLGTAIFVSLLPLTAWKTSWGSGWILRDYPGIAVCLLAGAIILWAAYIRLRNRLLSMH